MFILKALLIMFFTSNALALSSLEIGERLAIGKKSGYHFSSKDLIFIQSKLGTLYIVGKKIGELEYKKNNKSYKLLILNKEQNFYYKKVNFIVESSPLLKWSVKDSKLIIKGFASSDESLTLMNICKKHQLNSVSLRIGLKASTKYEEACLGLLKTYHLELAFLNKDHLSGHTYGTGIPQELKWRFSTKLGTSELKGAAIAAGQKGWARRHSFFEADATLTQNITFESGSEILIKPTGAFTRQQNEWKKALTTLNVTIDSEQENSVEMSLIVKRKKQSGEKGVFSVENFKQSNVLTINKWEKIFVFSDNGSFHSKNKFLGFSLLGSNSKNKSSSYKEFWVRVSAK